MKHILWRLCFGFFGMLIGLMTSLPLSAQHIPVAPVGEGVASTPAPSLLPPELETQSLQHPNPTWVEVRPASEKGKSSRPNLSEPVSSPEDPLIIPIALPKADLVLPKGFQWGEAVKQSFFFLAIQHSFRFATEAGTRSEIGGPFFGDYFRAVRSLKGWDDGDPFIVNYVGHTMMGTVSGFIQIHNDPNGINQEIGWNKSYWKSRLKALGWSAAFSTQFEIGPLSEAALGNVGIHPTKSGKSPMAYVDIVLTPALGTAFLITEDVVDRYLIRKIEDKTNNRIIRLMARSFLNPSRSFANILRGKWMWYRDKRPL
ncbi:MAG: hypothetical protein HY774_04995 [Acidobacteria bacterium]|nr:hypothetical protein [Acidobacteriota bacterium]